jgi:hypothetical protein
MTHDPLSCNNRVLNFTVELRRMWKFTSARDKSGMPQKRTPRGDIVSLGQARKFLKLRLGEVTERLKVHDWKSCVLQKSTGGSNPPLSAT